MAKRKREPQDTSKRRDTKPALLPTEEAETPGENQSQPDEPLPGLAEAPAEVATAPEPEVEWVTIKVPMYRGEITNYDVGMQATLDTPGQRDGWQRLHLGLAAVAKEQLNGAVVPIHRQHTKVDSARWLFNTLASAE